MDSGIICPTCGYEGHATETLRETGVHYSDLSCPACNRHLGFGKKPESDPTKYKRPKSHQQLVKKYSRGFCEMCLAKEDQLPKGQTLEANHVIEYTNGGEPTRDNIWIVCTACHRLIHWRRYYNIVEKVAEATTRWMS